MITLYRGKDTARLDAGNATGIARFKAKGWTDKPPKEAPKPAHTTDSQDGADDAPHQSEPDAADGSYTISGNAGYWKVENADGSIVFDPPGRGQEAKDACEAWIIEQIGEGT
jgi:hypothetical protein